MSDAVQTLEGGADSILEGEHVPEAEPSTSPERALWLAVIVNCWADAFSRADTMIQNTDRAADPQVIRGEARRWLTLDFGSWREDREECCALAGVDPDLIRQAARKKLAAIKAGETATAEVHNLDAAFARLLDSEESMSAGEVDSALSELAALEMMAA